jgi:lipoprotein-anchoring transpeptidase ErfK/SrfK
VVAVGGAAAITGIALAGALGFGTSAPAARQSPQAPSVAQQTTAAPVATADSGSSASGGGSNGWVVVKHPQSGRTSGAGRADVRAPALPADSGTGRRAVYAIGAQRVWLVDGHGTVIRTYPVSGSRRPHLIAPGTYSVYSRSLHAISFNHKETMEYMVRFAHGGHSAIGFHDIPVSDSSGSLVQSRSDLGTPLSAGCIRQWRPDAKAMWRFASDGTTVVVTA